MSKHKLIKLAKQSKKQKNYSNLETSLRTAISLPVIGTGLGTVAANTVFDLPLAIHIRKESPYALSKREINKLIDILKIRKPLYVDFNSSIAKKFHSPAYDSRTHTIHLPHSKVSAEYVAHELGHASANSLIRRAIQRGYPIFAGMTVGAPIISIAADPDSKVSKYSPVIAVVGATPILTEEAIASIKGYKALKRIGKIPPNALLNLAKAFGSYATIASGGVLASLAARHVKKKIKNS